MKKKIINLIRKYMPKRLSNRIRGVKIYEHDRKQFISSVSDDSFEKLKFKTLLNTHVLEKGLSHRKIRYGFGETVLNKLSRNLAEWNESGFPKEEFAYENCIEALNAYYIMHTEAEYDIEFLKTIFDEKTFNEIVTYSEDSFGGYQIINPNEKNVGHFRNLALNRFSTREFSDVPVSIEEIKECIRIAQKSPSACNRQSTRVHLIQDQDKMKKILDLQQGFRGYDMPKILLVTTVDTRAYNNVDDRNLGYVDGGLFTMSLLYALEDMLIGACLLNTAFNSRKDELIRKEMEMNPHEIFINFIPVGKMLDQTVVAKSTRVSVDSILNIH